jgi:hypothetical protein
VTSLSRDADKYGDEVSDLSLPTLINMQMISIDTQIDIINMQVILIDLINVQMI